MTPHSDVLTHADVLALPQAEQALYWRLLARLEEALPAVPDLPEETPKTCLRALWLLAAGRPLSAQAAAGVPLGALGEASAQLVDSVERRLAGTPLAHLTGRQRFLDLEMLAGPGALIPRRETELLALAAIERLRGLPQAAPRVADLCTGSANLAAALARAHPQARVLATDLSPAALALAQANLRHLRLDDRVTLRHGDLFEPLDASPDWTRVDLLTCNPPYISSARRAQMPATIAAHEPAEAFDGGPLGVTLLRRLMRGAADRLAPGGWLLFEVGAGQGPSVQRSLHADLRYARVEAISDARGEIRVLAARLHDQGIGSGPSSAPSIASRA
jgi:release factor glutamine methyltransferase